MLKVINKYLLIGFDAVLFTMQGYTAQIMNKNPIKEDWKCKIIDGQWSCDRSEKPKNIFNSELKTAQKEKALADDLGWVQKSSYLVGGYYNNDDQFTKALCKSKKTDISYENAEYDTYGTLIASGNIKVLQCDQKLYSNNAIVNFNKDQSSIRSLVLTGDVIVKQPSTGIVLRTKELDSNMNDGKYITGETYFRIACKVPNTKIYNKENFSGHLRGYTKIFKKEDTDNLMMSDSYITSGDPYDNDWKITGKNIDIDTKEKIAYVKDGFFEIKDIPVMYVPYFSHPISNKRKSGFLMNRFIQNDNSGFGVKIPYYFNLAPNYDLMLQSVIWSKRSYQANGIFRYMTNYFQGQFEGSIIPYDFKANKMRGAFTLSNSGNFQNGITTNFRYDYVSDSEYYNDFSAGDINLIIKTLLDRKFDINYTNDYIDSSVTLLDYGLVNNELNLANIPYAKLPEVKFNVISNSYTPDYLTLSAETINTHFYKAQAIINSADKNPVKVTNVNAFRFYESLKIAGNFSKTYSYFKPSLEVPIRYYQLKNRSTDTIKFSKNSVTSVLPIFNINTGAYFDRDYTTENGTYTQTLEPRLFYTYIPYQNQTDIPIFDSSLQNEQYLQMFQVNQFTGHDRINNANQVTYALESSITNKEDGTIIASAKIGQQMFFADRKVSLCQGNSNCEIFNQTNIFSPIMSSFELQVMKNIYLSAQINYRVKQQSVNYQVYKLSYKDENENIFNILYNNTTNNWNALTQDQINNGKKPIYQETITMSTIINLTDHWGIAALWNYNFEQKKIADKFVGVQYNEKSWAVRALWQTSAYTNKNLNDPQALGDLVNTFVFEFELKGLGGFGQTSQLSSRLGQINGYKPGEWGNGI